MVYSSLFGRRAVLLVFAVACSLADRLARHPPSCSPCTERPSTWMNSWTVCSLRGYGRSRSRLSCSSRRGDVCVRVRVCLCLYWVRSTFDSLGHDGMYTGAVFVLQWLQRTVALRPSSRCCGAHTASIPPRRASSSHDYRTFARFCACTHPGCCLKFWYVCNEPRGRR